MKRTPIVVLIAGILSTGPAHVEEVAASAIGPAAPPAECPRKGGLR